MKTASKLPVISASDVYTLYFSKGYYQEGEAAAKYLAHVLELPADKQVVQIIGESDEGRALARGFTDSWKKFGSSPAIDKTITASESTGADFWQKLAAMHPDAVLLLWLGPDQLTGIESLGELSERPSMVFVSSTMLGGSFVSIPDNIRNFTNITYPYELPEERQRVLTSVHQFWRGRGVKPANMAITEKVYSQISLFSLAFGGLKTNRYRDYFLDLIDMTEDQIGYGVRYPRLSFGPGQRYTSKGCYIVTLGEGPEPKLIKQSDWVIF